MTLPVVVLGTSNDCSSMLRSNKVSFGGYMLRVTVSNRQAPSSYVVRGSRSGCGSCVSVCRNSLVLLLLLVAMWDQSKLTTLHIVIQQLLSTPRESRVDHNRGNQLEFKMHGDKDYIQTLQELQIPPTTTRRKKQASQRHDHEWPRD